MLRCERGSIAPDPHQLAAPGPAMPGRRRWLSLPAPLQLSPASWAACAVGAALLSTWELINTPHARRRIPGLAAAGNKRSGLPGVQSEKQPRGKLLLWPTISSSFSN